MLRALVISMWEGRAMIGGQMSKVQQNVQLTANLLKATLGLSLTPEEAKLEEGHKQGMLTTPSPLV